MTKADLVSEVSKHTGLDRTDVLATVEGVFEVIKETLTEGDNLYVRGFGSFITKKRARKVARRIKDNTSMIVEEHYIPFFKPSKTFAGEIKESFVLQQRLQEETHHPEASIAS